MKDVGGAGLMVLKKREGWVLLKRPQSDMDGVKEVK
jgi:hypothetical protein